MNYIGVLSELFDDKKSYTIRVPYEVLFNRDKSVLIAYLAGLLDSDGSVYIKTHRGRFELIVEYTSRSKELINGVSFMLKRLRIHHVVKQRNVKGKPVYRVLIYGFEALKLLTLLKHYTATPLNQIIDAAENYYSGRRHNPNYDAYPIPEFLTHLRESLGLGRKTVEKELELSDRYLRQYEYGRRRIGYEVLRKLYEYYHDKLEVNHNGEAGRLLDKLRKLMDGDIYIEEIISIERVDPTDKYLYDLEVEDTHNFIIGQIGWRLNHNTTLLNVISMFIRPGMKIVTIEDTPEINLPHPNWVQLTSRETYLVGSSAAGTNIRLFDLVKLSLRYRPDYIIVGEIRGEEAFVLFQAMATGHGGLSSIHAETLDYAVKRLTSPPMNIAPPYIKLMNVFIHLKRVITRIEKGIIRVERRVTTIQEVADYGKYVEIVSWDPKNDRFNVRLENSIHLRDIADKRGLDLEDIIDEIYRKATVLNWMIMKNITNVWDVSRIIFDYYYDPATVYKRAVEELEEAGKKAFEEMAPATAPTEVAETEELVSGTREMGEATKELFERTRELGR